MRNSSTLLRSAFARRGTHLQQQSALWELHRARYSTNDDSNREEGGLLNKIWRAGLGQKPKDSSSSSSSAAGGSSSSSSSSRSSGASSGDALVPSGPERRHHKVFVVELSRKPLFPGIYTPVIISKNEALVKEIMDVKKQGAHAYVGAFLKRPEPPLGMTAAAAVAAAGETEVRDAASHLYDIGTFAQVHTVLAGDSADSAQLLLLGHRRIRKTGVISADPLRVHVDHLRDESYTSDDILKATSMEIVNTMRDLLQLNPLYGEQFRTLLSLTGSIDLQDMSRLVDAAASLTSADDTTLQTVLETLNVPERARLVLGLLKKEVELCKLQADIREQVEGKIVKEQRRMLLMEQLKSIKKELGLERDDKSALLQRFQARWDERKALAPPDVARAVQEELDKLGGLEPVSPEFNITRTYLDWLTSLPWGATTQELFDLVRAKKVLDDDHYGLEDVKDRILEFIAVSHLRGSAQGKILCLVGPPGVGKTSIGRSIAHALNRKYYRFSVGGLHDVAEIKGHRRTYVGAMPGKLVQCLKSTQSSNPLVLIDEVDKLGRGHSGDPASALLELLDPEQNAAFTDHYLDLPLDLSKVLFVCTANSLDTIPGPLLDRMEVIRLSGYAQDEKRAIARRYLEPAAAADAGVPPGSVSLADDALEALIGEYCREAGVRNLKKHVDKVYRKVALQLVRAGAKVIRLDEEGKTPQQQQQQGEAAVEAGAGSSSGTAEASTSTSTPSSTSSTATNTDSTTTTSTANSTSSKPAPKVRVEYDGPPITVHRAQLKDYVGQAPFAKDKFYESTPPGVVMGLAWTPLGGATLYVEAARVAGSEARGSLTTTGQLGDVFRESATIAHTYARNFLAARIADGTIPAGAAASSPSDDTPASSPSDATTASSSSSASSGSSSSSSGKQQQQQPQLPSGPGSFFSSGALHVHVPAGATPKDGPSAGCTLVTALLSLALDRPVRPDLAMTGEVTLTGCVLPIGGVKEKVLAARRSGVKVVVFPEGNRPEYEELAEDIKQGLEPHFVSSYDQVFKLALEHDSGSGNADKAKQEAPLSTSA
ncbi:hypothetical protein CHLRE_06g281350v5 [Chlamydomonas reinhardtii]|uniref:Lon protease homolog n=1 Tax=Chlamydomonas reinhardtii TaxID=3055 RepID=A0A2K3DPT0_CHLRE|nr:uncharacterized protein CHLRE_06g281350v5 [Chlamydomonas reinhardtii]PNW82498.1 hypothetical protein CHLRE_06g281350v5 [Chlamydomonas reinhardtii]